MAGNRKPVVALKDRERFPLINDLAYLNQMKQDECAPVFNFQSGDRVNAEHLRKVKQYANEIRNKKQFWEEGGQPDWLKGYLRRCIDQVPFYINRKSSFMEQPTINRGDIGSIPWNFVSKDARLDDMLVYNTSGTTGAAMDVLFDPVSQACWISQLQSVLDQHNIKIEGGNNKVSIALICSQSSTLTYASLSTYLNGAGILKLNLNPNDWRDPEDRILYLEKYNPEVLTGDPFAFFDLLELQPKITPKVLVSSAMKLTDGIKTKLEAYFKCPVLDVYSLTECRMVAFAENGRHRAIRPDLFLEVFDMYEDIALPYGERGELVITGGNNPFLPLIRYRTGDFCKLKIENGIPYLIDLEARLPVVFYKKNGQMINNIDISRALMYLPLAGFTLHQGPGYQLSFKGWSNDKIQKDVQYALRNIFGLDTPVKIIIKPVGQQNGHKPITYSSNFSPDL
ncbi:MAG: AMP-binding protein [Bacteroidales bacterium]|nr:AMP-binding protein [Bacteroidales bacterium]